jgi:lactate racemase
MLLPQHFTLKYGTEERSFSLPENYRIQTLHPKETQSQLSEDKILKIRLNNPLASKKLDEIITTNDSILLVVPDITRIARLDLIFPYLFKLFEDKNVPDHQVTILFASGSHSLMTDEEKIKIIGETAFQRFANYTHDCRESWCDNFGETSRGTPVLINHMVKGHTKIIVISSVIHHYFAGFGGGPKMIVPGLAKYETICNNHKLMVEAKDTPLHPACEPGNVIKNPIQEDITEAVKMVKVDFAFQLVLDQNKQLIDVFCGDLFTCFQKACMKVHHLNSIEISEQADLVIASAGGAPKDLNLVQSHKAIHHAVRALKPNGILIILADCKDGWGNPKLLNWFEYNSYSEMKKVVMANYELNANTALVLKYKLENYYIFLISSLPSEQTRQMGFYPFDDLNNALVEAKQFLPEKPFVNIIPNASLTLPV